jgi:hypothetical protein
MGLWSLQFLVQVRCINKMKTFIKNNVLAIVGVAIGALAGFLYWKFVGCHSGTCSITSDPLNSSVYGSIVGGFLFSTFEKNKTE